MGRRVYRTRPCRRTPAVAIVRPAMRLALGLALLLAAAARAQELTVQNLAPFPRREWCSVVVPFARGQVAAPPALHAGGRPTEWQPFGARWPDGSWRQALCLFRAELPALGELHVPLEEGTGPPLPEEEVALPPYELEFVVDTGATTARARPVFVRELEGGKARKVALLRARIGRTGLVGEVILTGYAGQEHAYADVAVFFSDPATEDMQRAVRELAIETRGLALWLRHPGPVGVEQQRTASGSRVVLLRDTVLGDGQGIRRAGVLVPPLRGDGSLRDDTLKAAAVCPPLGATPWKDSGAFGAYGLVPPPPGWLAGGRLRAAMAARHRAFVAWSKRRGDPFSNFPFGLERRAGQTGDQRDFGVVKLQSVAFSGLPSFLLEVELSVLQEACRPVHFFEADGRRVTAANHPDWVVWSGRTHWHCKVSVDRLGKPCPEPRFESHGWTGKDRQHWSSNYLGAFGLLTGQPWARRELENEVQLYLAGQTTRPELTTSGPGAPRGAGRTLLAATWMYLATGDPALLQRMNERLDKVYLPGWKWRELPSDKVRPLHVANPDGRNLRGAHRYWTPWQDAIAAVGFGAAYSVTGNDSARLLAEETALNVLRHGWRLDDRGAIIATAMRWLEGEPIPERDFDDPETVQWSHGTAFSQWAIGAVEIARATAIARGEPELARRAERIQQAVRAQRRRPDDGFYDRLTEWDAVRWPPPR